jgi:hypothetical protein
MGNQENKWLCHTDPKEVDPLPSVIFPHVVGKGGYNLSKMTGIPAAHVMATDKVIKISQTTPPVPVQPGPPHDIYVKEEWSYGEALAYTLQNCRYPLLIEMESYGIGMLTKALKIEDRVIIISVATDGLVDHAIKDDNQAKMLMQFRVSVLLTILKISRRVSEGV